MGREAVVVVVVAGQWRRGEISSWGIGIGDSIEEKEWIIWEVHTKYSLN